MKIAHGYVEYLDDASQWHSTLRINSLVGQAPDVTSTLFGVDDHYVKKPHKPIAASRGMPSDSSEEAIEAWNREREWLHFETWITPDEVAKVFEIKELKKGWSVVFAFMGVLAELYGESNVRLVVWFL